VDENRIIKLLDVSMLSDTTCVDDRNQSQSGAMHVDSPIAASNTPRSAGVLTRSTPSSVRESHGNASVSAYEDALAELSSTKTPVLPSRCRATPLRRSARKAAQSGVNVARNCSAF